MAFPVNSHAARAAIFRDTAAQSVVENIRRHRAGEELIGVVDRTLGY